MLDVFYKMSLKGSARKQASKISIRFTQAQKETMEFCFNERESDKRKRFTALKCQKLMQEKLCEELVLTEKQIKSYWSAYKRKRNINNIYSIAKSVASTNTLSYY